MNPPNYSFYFRKQQGREIDLEKQIKDSQKAIISLPELEAYIQLLREKLTTLDFDMKRLALKMLNIKIWVDNSNVEITWSVPIEDVAIASTLSSRLGHNHDILFPFSIMV